MGLILTRNDANTEDVYKRQLFYTTDISVTLWILNKNKKARVVEENGEVKRFRNREREILFMLSLIHI